MGGITAKCCRGAIVCCSACFRVRPFAYVTAGPTMRLTVLSAALIVSLGTGTPALSQSLPAFTWTGFYAGLNAGANFHGNDSTMRFFDLNQGYLEHSRRFGFSGGGQLGYNFQINSLVIGVETDIQSAFLRKSSGFFQSVFIPGFPGLP